MNEARRFDSISTASRMKVSLIWKSANEDDGDRGSPRQKPALAALEPTRDGCDEKRDVPGDEHPLLIEQRRDELPLYFIAPPHIDGIDKLFESLTKQDLPLAMISENLCVAASLAVARFSRGRRSLHFR
jgi:hypothetical protein